MMRRIQAVITSRSRLGAIAFLLLTVVAGAGCSSDVANKTTGTMRDTNAPDADPAAPKIAPPTATETSQSLAVGTFLQPFMRELLKAENQASVAISPAGITSAMALLSAGAQGETRAQLQAVFGRFAPPPGQFNLSGAVFYAPHVELTSDYERRLDATPKAAAIRLDSADPMATVNRWIAAQTGTRLPGLQLSSPVVPDIVVASAMHFDGAWREAFHSPADGPFTSADGERHNVTFVSYAGLLRYIEHGAYEAVQVSFAQHDVVMTLVLPTQRHLPAHLWPDFTRVASREVELTLPEFTTDTTLNLRAALQQAGVSAAFSTQEADFAALSPQPLAVADVIHQTSVAISRTGAKADSATAIVAIGSLPGVSLRFDRPFYYAIHSPDALLILGYFNG